MIFVKLHPFLACFGSYILAHSQHEGHTCWVVVPAEFSEYFIGGERFGQAVDADIVEVEDASYFDTFSETTWPFESFRQSIQDESTHDPFTHSLKSFPTFCSADRLALPSALGNGGVSTKTTSRESSESNVHRTYAKSVVQGDNDLLTFSFSSAAMFINLSPISMTFLTPHFTLTELFPAPVGPITLM